MFCLGGGLLGKNVLKYVYIKRKILGIYFSGNLVQFQNVVIESGLVFYFFGLDLSAVELTWGREFMIRK